MSTAAEVGNQHGADKTQAVHGKHSKLLRAIGLYFELDGIRTLKLGEMGAIVVLEKSVLEEWIVLMIK